MPTLFTHPAVAVAVRIAGGKKGLPLSLVLTGIAFTVIPDLDVIGWHLGIPYGSRFGHRGLSHSFPFAAFCALLAVVSVSRFRSIPIRAFLFLFVSMGSHGLLDAVTDGGLGIAFFSPFSESRYFLPWHPIEVSPLSPGAVVSKRMVRVLLSELRWVWFPLLAAGGGGALLRIACRRLLVRFRPDSGR